jgi:hypothetical protein
MKTFIAGALLLAGLINIYPLIGAISAEQLVKLYGVPVENSDLILLMRHRAILFGLLGSFIIYSAFRPSLQTLACIAGLISMITFIALACSYGDFGVDLNKAVVADVVGSVALVAVLLAGRMQKDSGD